MDRSVSRTSPGGGTRVVEVDPAGRLSRRTSAAGSAQWYYGEVRPGYSNAARPTRMVDGLGEARYDYEPMGRLARVTRVLDGVEYTQAWDYSPTGRITRTRFPDGSAYDFEYDAAGRVVRVPGVVVNVTYDPSGRPLSQLNANGTTTVWEYDVLGRVLHVRTTAPGGSTIQESSYERNASGRVTQVLSSESEDSWAYTYDSLGRLTEARNIWAPFESQSFQYGASGNKVFDSRLGSLEYPVAGAPRPHAPTAVGGTPMIYDQRGNLLSGLGRTITWNADDRPTQINGVSFAYAGNGARLKATSASNSTLYPLGYGYQRRNGASTNYLQVPGLGVVARSSGGVLAWLHNDRLGSVRELTDTSGTTLMRRSYRPFGEVLGSSGQQLEPLSYLGQVRDEETNLLYLNARYYDPGAGIFLSPDPADPALRELGRYLYAGGDPINALDPSGAAREVPEFGTEISCPGDGVGRSEGCPDLPGWWIAKVSNPDGTPTQCTGDGCGIPDDDVAVGGGKRGRRPGGPGRRVPKPQPGPPRDPDPRVGPDPDPPIELLPVIVQAPGDWSFSEEQVNDQIQTALSVWSAFGIGVTAQPVRTVTTSSTTAPSVDIAGYLDGVVNQAGLTGYASDQIPVVFLRSLGGTNAAGASPSWDVTQPGGIVVTRIGSGSPETTAHELGHNLGLGHFFLPGNLMFPTTFLSGRTVYGAQGRAARAGARERRRN